MFGDAQEEVNRINAADVVSDFEKQVSNEVWKWAMLQDRVWETTQDVFKDFWKEKLN